MSDAQIEQPPEQAPPPPIPLGTPSMLLWMVQKRGWDVVAKSGYTVKLYKADAQETVLTISLRGKMIPRETLENILAIAEITDAEYVDLYTKFLELGVV